MRGYPHFWRQRPPAAAASRAWIALQFFLSESRWNSEQVYMIPRMRMPGRVVQDGPSASAARRHVGRRIGCAVIVSAAGVALGFSVHHGLQTTTALLRPGSVRGAVVADRQEECIYRAIRSELPKGATVYINDPVHVQRLAELSTLWAVPQPSLATAHYRLILVPARGHCSGLALEVHRT
jgi:hypothetical protein